MNGWLFVVLLLLLFAFIGRFVFCALLVVSCYFFDRETYDQMYEDMIKSKKNKKK